MATQEVLSTFAGSGNTSIHDDRLAIDDVETPEDLREWANAYAKEVVDEHDMAVILDRVTFEVDTTGRRKTRVAEMKSVDLPVKTQVGIPIDWEKVRENVPLPDDMPVGDHRNVQISLTWDAFSSENFDGDDCRGALRHELIHAEQFHQSGTSNHRRAFKARAREIDAALECPTWKEPKYILYCSECEEQVGSRYRASKVTKNPEDYGSKCCHAPIEVETND